MEEKTFEELEKDVKKNFELLDDCDEVLEAIDKAIKIIKEDE